MTKQIDHNMPSITPDRDQVEAFKSTRTHTPSSSSTVSKAPVKTTADTQPIKETGSSTLSKLSTLLIYVLIAGAGYWVYLQDIKTTAIINSAEQRIAGLERQLSATGEEMGESAVEMKVRIETLGKTSDKLWQEMDKLWASAWRKNQSQIKKLIKETKTLTNLSTTQHQSVTTTVASIKDLSDKQVATEFSIDALKEQLKQGNAEWKAELKILKATVSDLFTELKGVGLIPKGKTKGYFQEEMVQAKAVFTNGQRIIDCAQQNQHASEFIAVIEQAMELGQLSKNRAIKIEQKLLQHKKLEDEVKTIKADIKGIEVKRDELVQQARENISNDEARQVIIERLRLVLMQSYQAYLRADQRACIAAIENLWQKYAVTAKEIETERDTAAEQLQGFLVELGYDVQGCTSVAGGRKS